MNRSNKDIDPAGRLVSNKTIFIWLDLLAFGDALEDENRYKELSELLKRFQDIFNNELFYETEIISDGIILWLKEPYINNPEKMKEIFADIGKKQLQFIIEKEEFIRGGIAVGTKFEKPEESYEKKDKGVHSEKRFQFISNGLSRAVKLESNYVDWPVIGTNKINIEEIIKLMEPNVRIDKPDETFGLIKGFNRDGKDLFFIDFLSAINDSKDKNLKQYSAVIKRKIKDFQGRENDDKKRNKYIWLLRYYCHKFKYNEVQDSIDEDIDRSLAGVIL